MAVLHHPELVIQGLVLLGGGHLALQRGDVGGGVLARLQVIAEELFGGVDGDGKGVDQLDIGLLLVDLAVLVPAILQDLHDLTGILQDLGQTGGVFRLEVDLGQLLLHVAQAKGDVVIHRHVGPQGIVLEQKAHFPLVGRDVDAQVRVKDHLVADGDAPAGGGLQPGDHAQGGSLAAAGGAQQGDEGVILDDQVQVVHGIELAPALGHVL